MPLTAAKGEIDGDDEYELRWYPDSGCKSCVELNSREMKEQPDDGDFLHGNEDFKGDDVLRLHVIHYRRKKWETGYWDIDCAPNYGGIGGQAYPGKHLYNDMKKNELLIEIAKHVVYTYNKEKGGQLVFNQVQNVSEEGCHWRTFYITFDAHVTRREGKRTRKRLKTYRAAVSCCIWSHEREKEILVFRDSSGADLLPSDPFYARLATPRHIETDSEDSEEEFDGDSKAGGGDVCQEEDK